MKRDARHQIQNNLSNKQHSDHLHSSASTQKNEELRQAKIIALPQNQISVEKLRVIWNDSEVTYTDSELMRIRDWFYTVAEITVSTNSRRDDQKLEVCSLSDQVTPPNKTIPFPLTDNQTTTTDDANKKSHSLHPSFYGRTG